ncbi:Chlorophyll a-b binding protein [Heracleum sosnowskyi]|uniref:Chlorophyll a-b binding protein n=1 Tax=Heracleum sosnowskyi TaxID=360622 RepID=A0AAD8ITS0_9APIA|nr:Chlorophyll a-b binding protein [Heracleum sosnowskyi]
MAKNRNKKNKKNDTTSMDITTSTKAAAVDVPQSMDTSENIVSDQPRTASIRKVKGVQMKRQKNVRKMKAIAKAVSRTEKSATKVLKNESKTLRTQSAKKLYD